MSSRRWSNGRQRFPARVIIGMPAKLATQAYDLYNEEFGKTKDDLTAVIAPTGPANEVDTILYGEHVDDSLLSEVFTGLWRTPNAGAFLEEIVRQLEEPTVVCLVGPLVPDEEEQAAFLRALSAGHQHSRGELYVIVRPVDPIGEAWAAPIWHKEVHRQARQGGLRNLRILDGPGRSDRLKSQVAIWLST